MAEAHVVRAGKGETYGKLEFMHGSRNGGPFDFMVMDVGYLTGPPLHVHEVQTDSFYILEGTLTVQIGDEVVELQRGDFAAVPPGVPHTFDNTRKDQPPVKICNVMTPSGLDAFIASVDKAQAWQDTARFKSIAEENGMTFVGPPLAAKLGLSK